MFSSWKLSAGLLTTLVAVCIAAYIYVTILNGNHRRELEALRQSLVLECKTAQKLTTESQSDLQKRYDATASKLAKLMRETAKCVYTTSEADHQGNGAGSVAGVGISTRWLDSQFAQCKDNWDTVIVLDKFLDDERQ